MEKQQDSSDNLPNYVPQFPVQEQAPYYPQLYYEPNSENREASEQTSQNQPPQAQSSSHVVREQDRFLPIANISRIMKK